MGVRSRRRQPRAAPAGSSSRACDAPVARNPDDGHSAHTAGARHPLRFRLERGRSGREGSRRSAHRVRSANAIRDSAMQILVATDGSPSAGLGVDLVAGLDLPAGTSVRAVEAIETGSGLFGGPSPSLLVQTNRSSRSFGRSRSTAWSRPAPGLRGRKSTSAPRSCEVDRPPSSSTRPGTGAPTSSWSEPRSRNDRVHAPRVGLGGGD